MPSQHEQDQIKEAEGAETKEIEDYMKDNPLCQIELADLDKHITDLFDMHFKKIDKTGRAVETTLTKEELQMGARFARNYGYHTRPDRTDEEKPRYTPSRASITNLVEDRVWAAIEIQQSKRIWHESKDLLITILACCMASMTQGWDQSANGNLSWPKELNVDVKGAGVGAGVWEFAAVNAITWFAASILGPFLVDPICYSSFFGRRGSVFLAACFSLGSSIGASRAKSWQGLMIARFFLGIGIGAKASIVPIWESEVLPPSKRGRVLVSWQVFTAVGIFAGSVATYIFRDTWRNQVLSGALPALILLILTYLCCESPRWLIIQGKYVEAFQTLVRLRKERLLAAEEFCYIYFQIQYERAFSRGKKNGADPGHFEERIGYAERLPKIWTLARNRHAAIASMIVMLSQQLSGINILAFLASIFFTAVQLRAGEKDGDQASIKQNLGLGIGFGAANAIFSAIAYFLIEPLPEGPSLEDVNQLDETLVEGNNKTSEPTEAKRKKEKARRERQERLYEFRRLLYGRRRLLLQSLAGGTVMLFILTFLLRLPSTNPNKLGAVTAFIFLFTLCYSPGAGAVPFLYSAEIWPNEGREVGMSWAVAWNFLGSGFLALFVPRGLNWGSNGVNLFGVFTGFSFLGFLLVYFFVPGIPDEISLERMSRAFQNSLLTHGKNKLSHITQKKKKAVEPSHETPQQGVQATGALPHEEVDHADAGTFQQVA